MTNKKENALQSWSKNIEESGKLEREIAHKLTPSKGEMDYVTSYAKTINDKAIKIEMASTMAHEGLITFEIAQKIIDVQKKQLAKDIDYLKTYLDI